MLCVFSAPGPAPSVIMCDYNAIHTYTHALFSETEPVTAWLPRWLRVTHNHVDRTMHPGSLELTQGNHVGEPEIRGQCVLLCSACFLEVMAIRPQRSVVTRDYNDVRSFIHHTDQRRRRTHFPTVAIIFQSRSASFWMCQMARTSDNHVKASLPGMVLAHMKAVVPPQLLTRPHMLGARYMIEYDMSQKPPILWFQV